MIRSRPELSGFARGGPATHVLVCLGGVALVIGTYLGTAVASGADVGAAGSATVHRNAIAAAALACWTYFAAATIVARGGPLLNTVFYPAGIVAVVPALVDAIVFDVGPRMSFTTGVVFSREWAVDVLIAFGPGIAVAALLLGGWFYGYWGGEDRRRWVERNLSAEFREEFIDGPRRRARDRRNDEPTGGDRSHDR